MLFVAAIVIGFNPVMAALCRLISHITAISLALLHCLLEKCTVPVKLLQIEPRYNNVLL